MLIENMEMFSISIASSSHGDTSFRDSNSQINGSKRSWNKRNMAIDPTVSTPLKGRVRLVPGSDQVCTGNGIELPT